jgi:hypothetical protein
MTSRCQFCECDLEGQDVFEKMKEAHPKESDEYNMQIAECCYGWSKQNPIKFSNAINVYNWEKGQTDHVCPRCNQRIEFMKTG